MSEKTINEGKKLQGKKYAGFPSCYTNDFIS